MEHETRMALLERRVDQLERLPERLVVVEQRVIMLMEDIKDSLEVSREAVKEVKALREEAMEQARARYDDRKKDRAIQWTAFATIFSALIAAIALIVTQT